MTALSSRRINEQERKVAEAAPELAKHARARTNAPADGGIHAIKRGRAKSRKQEAADVSEVVRAPVRRWQRASALAQLPKLAGHHVEYVRRDNRNRGDHENLLAHLQEGWDFVRRGDYASKSLPTQRLSEFGEVIGNGNTILMKIPDELYAQRREYYDSRRDATTKQISRPNPAPEGVSHHAMPIVEDVVKHTVSQHNNARSRRLPPRVADDT